MPNWFAAVERRSKAMDAYYHLGRFARGTLAPHTPSSGFQWGDAAIGAGFTASLMLAAALAMLTLVRRHQGRLSRSA